MNENCGRVKVSFVNDFHFFKNATIIPRLFFAHEARVGLVSIKLPGCVGVNLCTPAAPGDAIGFLTRCDQLSISRERHCITVRPTIF